MVKRKFGHAKKRYRRLAKNTAQPHTLFALANLWLVRPEPIEAMAGVRPKLAKSAMPISRA